MAFTTYRSSDVRTEERKCVARRTKAIERLEEPIRTDPAALQELQDHARRLADRHRVAAGWNRDGLSRRLDENACLLQEANRRLSLAAQQGHEISEAAVWLLDNRYLIQDEIRVASRDLPKKYGMRLPRLTDGSCEGLPRVYALVLELVARLDGQLNHDTLHAFVHAYQERSLLTLGELWAVPIMLRLAGIESLGHAAMRIVRQQEDAEHQAADTTTVRNSISSLRMLGALDWNSFVEEQSIVERILHRDPAGIYKQMDFASRDYYRHVIEMLAQRSSLTEQEIAQCVLDQAQSTDGQGTPQDPMPTRRQEVVRQHVGYFLVDAGRATLEKAVGYRLGWREALARLVGRVPLTCYLGAILLVWLLAVVGTGTIAWQLGIVRLVRLELWLLLLVLFAGAASQFAVSLVNWICTLVVPPRPIMRLDFSSGIPRKDRTLVAVPAMLTNEQTFHNLIEQLELRYLANRDDNLLFVLLTDFPDASQEALPGDRRLLALARARIRRLNHRYRRGGHAPFYLLHRPRKWNAQQGVWMGEERKRGKLGALNNLLKTAASSAFSFKVGDLNELSSVRYVITLDADTRLPPQTGRDLVGCMAHPLNWPEIDPATGTVVQGYAILQPRIGASIPDATRSLFSQMLAGDAGIDPYTRQTSDMYHDIFARGSFIGKGIYDVDAFETVLGQRFPANRILSHDLIEGCFARSGVVDDIELFEGVPSGFMADLNRRHRWIRGDWQIASWLGPRVPLPQGQTANPLDALSRWKIFDNLRRSLAPIFLLGFLIAGLVFVPAAAGCWAGLALLLTLGPAFVAGLSGLFRRPEGMPWRLHVSGQGRSWLRALGAEIVCWSMLPHTAYSNADAILRTLYRLHISRRNLLEWTTSNDSESLAPTTCPEHYVAMWPCVVTGTALAMWLAVDHPQVLPFAALPIVSWLAGPLIAWWTSRPSNVKVVPLAERQIRQFRRWARQTWHYFEAMVSQEDHWLPPDNVQEDPRWTVAHRTSPTNIGMGLLADLAAHDLGYVSTAALIERTSRTFHTLGRLERYRGHFLNWYDTHTLQPIEPRYVSSVDSGNLWGAFTVLHAGLLELRTQPFVPPHFLEGLRDTLDVIAALGASPYVAAAKTRFAICLARLQDTCAGASPGSVRDVCRLLCRIRSLAANLAAAAKEEPPEVREWTDAFVRQSASLHGEIAKLAFWTRFPGLACSRASEASSLVPRSGEWATTKTDASIGLSARHTSLAGNNGTLRQATSRPSVEILTREERLAWDELQSWIAPLDQGCSLKQLATIAGRVAERISRLFADMDEKHADEDPRSEFRLMLAAVRRTAEGAASAARDQLRQISVLTGLCRRFSAMDFRFLYDSPRKLLSIGYRVSEQRRDDSYYGMLASEARLASFLAVSHGQLPLEHWFALSRAVTLSDAKPVLLSWSGSMFEYLMPMLLMPSFPGAVLDSSCRHAVRRQIHYAQQQSVPWGMSESCWSLTDDNHSYQYRAFGVPGLGLMRGLADRLVVAPYASAMAAMIAPDEAWRNLDQLERLGYLSSYGFYDAIDYSQPHDPHTSHPTPCRTVMAHHSGMTLLALVNVVLNAPMPQRFMKTHCHVAYDLLLQERFAKAFRPIDPPGASSGCPGLP